MDCQVYIGINVPRLMLRRGAVYRGGLPEPVKALIADAPILQSLFVSPSGLAVAEKNIKKMGTPEHTALGLFVKHLKKGGQ